MMYSISVIPKNTEVIGCGRHGCQRVYGFVTVAYTQMCIRDSVIVGRNTAFDVEDPEYKKKHQEQFEAYCKERGSMKGRLASGEELYLDFEDASDEEIEYVKWSLGHEGKCNTILRNMEAEGTRFQDVRIPYQYTDLVQTACTRCV